MKRAFAQRQIPTLLGLGILVAALVGGIALIGTGGGVFAPRATPQTTPKNIKITNVKDTSFTVSFLTDEATAGFVKYGKSADTLATQASDDRDQLTGSVGQFTSHYITIRELDPDTQYYFTLGTSSTPRFDNNGNPFSIKTAKRGGSPTAAKTAYGTVNTASGAPADGAIVYLSLEGVGELSALVKGSGSWAIPLSSARTTDLSSYANIQPTDQVALFVQGAQLNQTASAAIPVADTQPAPLLTLGSNASSNPGVQAEAVFQETPTQPAGAPATDSLAALATTAPSPSLAPTASPDPSPAAESQPSPTTQRIDTVDLSIPERQTVETSQPTITGRIAPNTVVSIEINSETKITQQLETDANGNFVLPLSNSNHQLEPGEHTITLRYTDPNTGEAKTVVRTFFVSAGGQGGMGGAGPAESSSTLLAQANPSPTPFGSGNPFTIPSPSPSPQPSPSPVATATVAASPRVVLPATDSAIPQSGTTSVTLALILGGFFLIGLGIWTYRYNWQQALIDSDEDSP